MITPNLGVFETGSSPSWRAWTKPDLNWSQMVISSLILATMRCCSANGGIARGKSKPTPQAAKADSPSPIVMSAPASKVSAADAGEWTRQSYSLTETEFSDLSELKEAHRTFESPSQATGNTSTGSAASLVCPTNSCSARHCPAAAKRARDKQDTSAETHQHKANRWQVKAIRPIPMLDVETISLDGRSASAFSSAGACALHTPRGYRARLSEIAARAQRAFRLSDQAR